jgi:UDP:flavonoid glycosyltransferase YjiC (YdhE family)
MNIKTEAKTILIAPLNWGLGHATRCIPIIRALLKNNYIPIIASWNCTLHYYEKFSAFQTLELPSYHVEYAENGANFKWN